jgi:hypothetical protein
LLLRKHCSQTNAPQKVGFGATNNWLYTDARDGTGGDPYKRNTGVGYDVFGGGALDSGGGSENTAVGDSAGSSLENGVANTFVGLDAGFANDGSFNVGVGVGALEQSSGSSLVGIGESALQNTSGSLSVGVGYLAGITNTSGYGIFIGGGANPLTATDTNTIVIGTSSVGNGANTTVIGNTNTVSAHILASGYTGAGTKYLSDDGTYKLSNPWGFAAWFARSNTVKTNFQSGNLSSGVTDIYTVPANYKFVGTVAGVTTNAPNNSTLYLKRSATYYRIASGNTTLSQTALANIHASGFVFDAADSLSVSNVSAGANMFVSGFLVPSSVPMASVSEFALDNTIKTLYTVPASTTVYFGYPTGMSLLLTLQIVNYSGASCTYKVYIVPNGGSPLTSNLAVNDASIANAASASYSLPFGNPGDSIQIQSSSSTAGQVATMFIYEEPN